MSVVVIRNNVMASDSGGSIGNLKIKSRKIIRRGDVVIGFVGNILDGEVFANWYHAGADLDTLPKFHNRDGNQHPVDFTALVLTPDGWTYWDEWFVCDSDMGKQNEFVAIGSGGLVAMGAMYMGATAFEAVKAACKHAIGCEFPIICERLGG